MNAETFEIIIRNHLRDKIGDIYQEDKPVLKMLDELLVEYETLENHIMITEDGKRTC